MRAALITLTIAAGTAGCERGQLYQSAFESAALVPNITSLMVMQDGNVMREAFYAGTDATTPHDVRSVTKTVTALVAGIAIDEGCLVSLDQPIGTLLDDPALADAGKAAITVRELLSMASGLAWTEDGAVGDYNAWAMADDQVDFVLARSIVSAPGKTFNYDSGAFHLVSAIISHACAPTQAFANQRLFAPLGITTPLGSPTRAGGWETDNQGIANGASGLQLSTTELAAIGQLILDRGTHHLVTGSAQVVPGDYIDSMTHATVATGTSTAPGADQTPSYGLGVWLGEPAFGKPFVLGEGYGGQFVVIEPDANAVVVATTTWQGLDPQTANGDYDALYSVIVNQLLPSL
jgi:CubicO group peptidase (beta-lactamase class C family)